MSLVAVSSGRKATFAVQCFPCAVDSCVSGQRNRGFYGALCLLKSVIVGLFYMSQPIQTMPSLTINILKPTVYVMHQQV